MKLQTIILVIVILCFLNETTYSQNNRFNAGLIAGLNFSELEGDGIMDYYGLNVGLLGTAKLSRNAQIGIELLFSQNGEYILPAYYPKIEYGTIWLNHIEVPLHIDWLLYDSKSATYPILNCNLGIAYTRIISHTLKDIDDVDVTDQVIYKDKVAYSLQTGTTYNFTKHLGVNLKASLPIEEELDWTLTARIIYTFLKV